MELVINKSKFKDIPIRESKSEEFTPGGILNSNYKKAANAVLSDNTDSLYNKRNTVKSRLYRMTNVAETVIKLSIFLTLLGFLI